MRTPIVERKGGLDRADAGISFDLHLADQSLDVRAQDVAVVKLLRPDFARGQRRGHGELDAEFGFQRGLRRVVAQNRNLRLADPRCDRSHRGRIEIIGLGEVDHRVDHPMRAIADRIFLERQPHRQDTQVLAEALRERREVDRAFGRHRAEETRAALKRIFRAVHPRFRQTRGEDARRGRPPDLEALRHAAEIATTPPDMLAASATALRARSASRPMRLATAAAAATTPTAKSGASL